MSVFNKHRSVKAVVQKVFPKGSHGPYAVTTAEGIEGSITFSLKGRVWNETDWPEPGEFVLLSEFRQKRAGWRAMKSRFYRPMDEQIANSKEHIMKTVSALIERWKTKFFPSEADQIWKDWVDFKKRESSDLMGLLEDEEFQDEFKARALFILLTPDLAWCPFYWIDHDRIIARYNGYFGLGITFDLDGLSPDLLIYVAELITEFYQHQKDKMFPKEFLRTMSAYNSYIISLLAVLPEEEAKKIFPLFEIKDLSTWWNPDTTSGYNPLEDLFRQSEVDEKWKREADQQMRQVILGEVSGSTQPRTEHEDALRCYAYIVQMQLYGDGLSYSKALFVDQIRFIVEVAPKQWSGCSLIGQWHIAKIFKMIATEAEENLLHSFSRFVLAAGDDEFSIYDSGTFEAAELMLGVIEKDHEVAGILQDAILSSRQRMAEEKKQRQEKVQVEQAILQKMKRSVD